MSLKPEAPRFTNVPKPAMIKQMLIIDNLKHMRILRWILIPILGLIWYYAVGAVLFVLSLVGILNFEYYELFSGILFSAGWITMGAILAPWYRKKVKAKIKPEEEDD